MLKQILALSLLFYAGGLRAEKIGVIIGSFGDVDKKEIKDYVQTTLKDKEYTSSSKDPSRYYLQGG